MAYLNIPFSCRFGGCKKFMCCPNMDYQDRMMDSKNPKPCWLGRECFSYMDKYNNDMALLNEIEGEDHDSEDDDNE